MRVQTGGRDNSGPLKSSLLDPGPQPPAGRMAGKGGFPVEDSGYIAHGGAHYHKSRQRSFGKAFAEARKMGALEFEWKNPKTGKVGKYHTRQAEESEDEWEAKMLATRQKMRRA